MRTLQIDPVDEYEFVVPEINENKDFNNIESVSLRGLIDQILHDKKRSKK